MIRKLFSVKFGDWEKSLSYETTDFVNGIFKQFTNCNPFEGRGAFTPTAALGNEIGSGTIDKSKLIRVILPVYAGETGFYALADDYKLYFTNLTTLSDVSAQIATGTATAVDALKWKSNLIYAMSGEVRSNAIPAASASDAPLLSVNPTSNLCVGPDRDLYVGVNNNVAYARASGTGVAVAASLETNNIVKKLLVDGRYLVWIADDSTSPTGKNLITVAWWNLASSTFDQIWQFEGGTFSGAEMTGNSIKILTPSGIWLTNFSIKPFLAVPFGGSVATTDIPLSSNTTGIHKGNIMFWGTYDSSGNIYGYGNKIGGQPDRLFQFQTAQTRIRAIASNNTNFLIASGTSVASSLQLKSYTVAGSTLNTAIANLAGFSLGKPYTFHHARVVLKSPISSGDSVSLQILTSNSTKTVLASSTKTNTTDSGERNLVFDHVAAGDGSDIRQFEDISDVKLTTNVAVNSLEVWGEEADERGSYG